MSRFCRNAAARSPAPCSIADAAVPAPVSRKAGRRAVARFGVYRNNVYASLIDVLAGRFPVVARLVGEEFFRAMARAYVEQEPPRSAVLLRYGAGFAAFVAAHFRRRLRRLSRRHGRARIGLHAAYHAADAAPRRSPNSPRAADHAAHAVLKLHPSLGVVRSPTRSCRSSSCNVDERRGAATARRRKARRCAVARPQLEVEIRRLAAGARAVHSLAL